MKRITIRLPDDLDARLRCEAARRSISIAAVVCDAIDQHMPPARPAGRLSFSAIGEGSPADASERVDEIVSGALARRHHNSAA